MNSRWYFLDAKIGNGLNIPPLNLPRGLHQMAVNRHKISDAEKAESVAGTAVQIVANRAIQLGTLEK